jgi:hypothetical protein
MTLMLRQGAAEEAWARRKALSTAACFLLIGFAAAATGCGNKVAQASRDLAAKITHESPSSANDPGPRSDSDEKRVYLDASLSMKGFVNPKAHSRFDEFIDTIGDVMTGCQLYKYGQAPPGPGGDDRGLTKRVRFGLELHRPEFYDLVYNPDDLLIEGLAGEEHPALSVLITDGVYSEPQGATSPPVVQAIQKWMDRGNAFGILILRSRFDGPFYSEGERRMLPRRVVEQRPFYAFVFSRTPDAFRDLREKLGQRLPDAQMQAVLFSDDAITCAPKLDAKQRGLYSSSAPPRSPYYWQMFSAELFARQNPARVRYDITCNVSPDYPVSDVALTPIPEYYRWERGAYKKADRVPAGFEAAPSAGAAPGVTVSLPKDTSSDYGFYHLGIVPSQKSLRPDIEGLSTRDDRPEAAGGRTFRFLEFVAALADTHFKTRLAPRAATAVFVTVENH